eukprot:1501058-Amphidinium_carterae.1
MLCVMNAHRSTDEVEARKFDLVALALMGLVVIGTGRAAVSAFADGSEAFLEAANRLTAWDGTVVVDTLRTMTPTSWQVSVVEPRVADEVCQKLFALRQGLSVDMSMANIRAILQLECLELPLAQLAAPAGAFADCCITQSQNST